MKKKVTKPGQKTITVTEGEHHRAVLASTLVGLTLGEFSGKALDVASDPILKKSGLEKVARFEKGIFKP